MYFADLSDYTYSYNHKKDTYNIGWLDIKEDYSIGNVKEEFVDALCEYIPYSVVKKRGFHECNLCSENTGYLEVVKGRKKYNLGSAEIRVIGLHGKIYSAPNLIYHYVTKHNYKPPEEFIDAVLNGCKPGSLEYIDFIIKNGYCTNLLEMKLKLLRILKLPKRILFKRKI